MNIIIMGLGKIGLELTEQLSSEGHAITVIDRDPKRIEYALGLYDVAGVVGSITDHTILREAGAENADLAIALAGVDEINLTSCLMCKKLGAKNTIARVRKPEYYEGINLIRKDLGLSLCIYPERETASEIARVLKFPDAQKVEPFAKGKTELIEYVINQNNPLCGKSVSSVFSKLKAPVIACSVERDGKVIIPYGDFVFEDGDTLILLGVTENISAFFKSVGIKTTSIHNVIIIGGGSTAFFLAEKLRKMHIGITIIEIDKKAAERISEALPDINVIHGDGTDHQILAEEGVRDADAICCLTGIDEENVLSSLYAKTVNENVKTITKVSRSELSFLARQLEVGSIVTPKKIAANIILRYVRALQNSAAADNVLTLYKLADGKAEALEFVVSEDSSLVGIPIMNLGLANDIIVASINRQGKIISPRGSSTLEPGDTVIIVTTRTGLDCLEDIRR